MRARVRGHGSEGWALLSDMSQRWAAAMQRCPSVVECVRNVRPLCLFSTATICSRRRAAFASTLHDASGLRCSSIEVRLRCERSYRDAAPSGSISIYIAELRDSVSVAHRCSTPGEHPAVTDCS